MLGRSDEPEFEMAAHGTPGPQCAPRADESCASECEWKQGGTKSLILPPAAKAASPLAGGGLLMEARGRPRPRRSNATVSEREAGQSAEILQQMAMARVRSSTWQLLPIVWRHVKKAPWVVSGDSARV